MNATEQQWGLSRHRPNSAFDVMALAASADGLKVRQYFLTGLTTGFPASVLVIQRLCPAQPSLLADIVSRRTALIVKQTMHGDVLLPAIVFTPVSDRHPLLRPDGTLSQATRNQFVRLLLDFALVLRTLPERLGAW